MLKLLPVVESVLALGWYETSNSHVTLHAPTSEAGAHRVWNGTILVVNEGSMVEDTDWCSEIGSLTSLGACNSGASNDRREPISLHQAVHGDFLP